VGADRPAGWICVRAAAQDRDRMRSIVTALVAEGFLVRRTLKPVRARFHDLPVIFVCSQANSLIVDFANEIKSQAERKLAVIVTYQDLSKSFLRNIIEHTPCMHLAEWNGRDRSFAEFRDLVLACRRVLRPRDGIEPLAIADLVRWRAKTAARTTLAAKEWSLLNQKSEDQQPHANKRPSEPNDSTPLLRTRAPLLRVSRDDAASDANARFADYRLTEALDHEEWLRQIISTGRQQRDFVTQKLPVPHKATGKPQTEPTPKSELLDASLFGPKTAAPGDQILVQVFLHRLSRDEASHAQAMARAADGSVDRRIVSTLDAAVARGQRIDVTLEAHGLVIDHSTQYLIWRGNPRACQFLVTVPRKAVRRTYYLETSLSIDGTPIGVLGFILRIGSVQKAKIVEIRGERSRRHDYAFVSYASPDRGEVYKRVQALNATGIKYFQDRLSLEPGTHWKPRLRQEIDRCDLFLLFWSEHAAKSKWVIWETKYALRRQKATPWRLPYIWPVPLAGVSRAPVPKWLSHIHFHDPLRDQMVADETDRQRDKIRAQKRG
jgi:TIR domain